MNRADLLWFRAEDEVRGLDQVWQLLHAAQADLTLAQRASLTNKYMQHSRHLAELKQHAGRTDWRELAETVRGTADFEREVFCFVVGRLLRPLGQGAGAAADRLLAELADRTGITVPPITGMEFELGWETLAPLIELVRLRFPGAGVWDLPILAHEFGHYALGNPPAVDHSDLRMFRDVQVRLVQELKHGSVMPHCMGIEADDDRYRQCAEELMADVFATFTIGPAYPQCCIALRVPAAELDLTDERHPPWPFRVTAMIETLQRMADLSRDGRFLRVVKDDVQALWQVVSGGPGSDLSEADLYRLQQWIRDITSALQNVSELMYDDGRRAGQIVDLLDDPGEGMLPPGTTVAHVLNAAWKWRLDGEHMSPDEIVLAGERFLQYCMKCDRGDPECQNSNC
jgi:hypothetical protein